MYTSRRTLVPPLVGLFPTLQTPLKFLLSLRTTTQNTPRTGLSCLLMGIFAVGKPIVLPCLSPCATRPLIEKALPRSFLDISKEPFDKNPLIAELLTRWSSMYMPSTFSITNL